MTHGGARLGAGRPKGQGKYGEKTRAVRLPVSRVAEILNYLSKNKAPNLIPLYGCSVRAGFPSPADDYIEDHLNLNDYLIKHPEATFFVRALGESMINAGIHSGDLLIVDRSIEAVHGKVVIAAVNGELTVKRLWQMHGKLKLLAENDSFPPIEVHEGQDVVIWGVVINVIHAVL